MARNQTTFVKGRKVPGQGRPKGAIVPTMRAFPTAEDLREKVQEYVDKTPMAEATMTGLVRHLGVTWDTFMEYAKGNKGEDYKEAMAIGRQYVEEGYERDLKSGKPVGAIFALKNINAEQWADKKVVEQTGHVTHGLVLLPKREYQDVIEAEATVIEPKELEA